MDHHSPGGTERQRSTDKAFSETENGNRILCEVVQLATNHGWQTGEGKEKGPPEIPDGPGIWVIETNSMLLAEIVDLNVVELGPVIVPTVKGDCTRAVRAVADIEYQLSVKEHGQVVAYRLDGDLIPVIEVEQG